MSKKDFSHVRHAYSGSQCADVIFNDDSLTQQQFRDSCDINSIMRTYDKTGVCTHLNQSTPTYGDFTHVVDYQTALNQVMAAQDAFMQLDPLIRARFSNDPGELLSFLDEPSNRDEAIKLGLIQPTVVQNSSAVSEEPPK